MNEKQILMAIFVIYLNTVVGRLAYILGREKGEEDERNFRKSCLGVGTIWRVGDDGRFYRVENDEQ